MQVASGEQLGFRAEQRWNYQHIGDTIGQPKFQDDCSQGQLTVERHVVARVSMEGGSPEVSQLS
eukprot:COSAG02_NODE_1401_length_12832_cov_20.599702_2_plen_64_part_00